MKTRHCLSWHMAVVLCGLSFTGNVTAAKITYDPAVTAPEVDTGGDVVLVGSSVPNINLLPAGFSLSRSYTVGGIKNNGNGSASWTASRDFESNAVTAVSARIFGDTHVTFASGDVVFTVSATIVDTNSGKVTNTPVFQVDLLPGNTAVSWDLTSIVQGIEKSSEPFDDTLSLQASVLWSGFNANGLLSVDSQYAVTMDAIPEPSSWLLLSAGVLGFGWRLRGVFAGS